MKEIFKKGDKVKVLKVGENKVFIEMARGIVSRVADENWIYFTDKESSNQNIEELIPIESTLTRVIHR